MKKITALFVMLMLACGSALAMTPAEEKELRFQEMKKIKEAQRAARESKKNEAPGEPSKWQKFWKSEGERSGLGTSGNRFGTFAKNLNPVPFFKDQDEKYKARKAGGAKI